MRLLLLFIGLSCFGLKAQLSQEQIEKLDSLAIEISNPENPDSIRIDGYFGVAAFIYMSDPRRAIDSILVAKKISEELNYPTGYEQAYAWLGYLYGQVGDLENSLTYSKKSLVANKKAGNLAEYGSALGGIAGIHYNLGFMDSALIYYENELRLRLESGDTLRTNSTLNNIGTVYRGMGDFPKALEYYEKALDISIRKNQKPAIANIYVNLGYIQSVQNNKEKAREYYAKSLSLETETGNLRGMSQSHDNLGSYFANLNQHDSAMYHYKKSLAYAEQFGAQDKVAKEYRRIAGSFRKQEKYQEALIYYNKALKLLRNLNDVQELAYALLYKGDALFQLDQLDSALICANEGYEIVSGLNFSHHNRVCHHLSARIAFRISDLKLAEKHMVALVENNTNGISYNFPLLSEKEKERYVSQYLGEYGGYYKLCNLYQDQKPSVTDRAYNSAMMLKGILLKSSTAMRQSVLNSKDSLMIQEYESWIALNRRINKQFARGNHPEDLIEKANQLEKSLVRKSAEFQSFSAMRSLDWKQIQKELEDGESAIEFVSYNRSDKPSIDSLNDFVYGAILIKSDSQHPQFVELFQEGKLYAIVESFPGNNLSYIEQVYGTKENTKSQLYDLIWKPLEPHLAGIKKVYVSPVGLLHKISFAALAKDQDVYLCDNYDIEMMSSTGNLAVRSSSGAEMNENANYTLFGGIEYNSDSTTSEIWSYLNGSLSETEKIEKTLSRAKRKVSYYNLSQATEGQFKKTASESNVLHIATHGFFYANPDEVLEASVDEEESKKDLVFRGGTSGMGVNTFVKSRNPLMRSGLVFAGANDVWNRTSIEGEDGVLTAAEVATIDMRNTELVVLSACETGLGDIKGSEGVYGLQRSFKMAGVKYLIMSLWQVPDKETAEFMTTFYEKLTENNDIKKAFKETQLEMRKKYDPYYWAAFVLVE